MTIFVPEERPDIERWKVHPTTKVFPVGPFRSSEKTRPTVTETSPACVLSGGPESVRPLHLFYHDGKEDGPRNCKIHKHG
jgi:hypothetical protein